FLDGLCMLGLRDETGKLVHSAFEGGNARAIAFDPESKGFKVNLNTGQELVIDPSRKSQRLTTIKGDLRTTMETFQDNHWVLTEKKGAGPTLVRGFSDTSGTRYQVAYRDEKDPSAGVTVTLPDGRPIRETLVYGNPTAVTDEGVIKFKTKDAERKD